MIVKGNEYPSTLEVAGERLALLGAGLREKWWFDMYTMAAYSESGACHAGLAIATDEIKHIRIDMLRDLTADKMAGALRKALARNLQEDASADLRAQVETLLSYFQQDLAAGASLELTYVPGAGTTLWQNGTQQGAVQPGKALADALWSCYFSSRTCCPGLKAEILASCAD